MALLEWLLSLLMIPVNLIITIFSWIFGIY
jgi:hypothetical protein